MIGSVKVAGSVLIFGVVAAAHMAASLTHAQVHPLVAQGYAFGAHILLILDNGSYATEVNARRFSFHKKRL